MSPLTSSPSDYTHANHSRDKYCKENYDDFVLSLKVASRRVLDATCVHIKKEEVFCRYCVGMTFDLDE